MIGQATEIYHLPGFHEPFSAVSHLFGAVLFVFLGMMLLRKGRGSAARLAFLSVYAGSCVLLFALSGVYHMMVRGGTARLVMERLDHGAIFVLIAGTFTAVHGLLFRGWKRWGALLFVWTAAVTGITLKIIFLSDVAAWLGLTFYLALGWFGLGAAVALARRHGFAFIKPLLWGALAYSIGGALEVIGWPAPWEGVVHAHDVFHLAVLAGALWHWWFVWSFATGEVAPAATGAK